MFGALVQITFREWQQHKLRLGLTILGISLGVAVFFAIQTTNQSLVSSLHATVEKLAGKSTLQIVAGETGFPLDILQRVRSTPGVQYAEPLTETFASTTFAGGEKLLILGLDLSGDLKIYEDSFDQGNLSVKNPLAFSSRADSIAVTRSFAARFSLRDGDKITIDVQSGRREMTVRGLFSASGAGSVFDGNVAVMDLAAAQDAFGRGQRIDRIDISNTPDVSVEELQKRLSEWLPSGIRAVRPDLRGQGLENAVSSLHYGLRIMSFLALSIAVFIIFNSFGISLNQRWKQIGIMRSLGVGRGNVQRMFLFEAALMGTIGSAIGIAGGYGLAKLSMRFVGDVTSSFYGLNSTTQALQFDLGYVVQAVIAGIFTSLIAAWLPSRTASNLAPALALHNVESRQRESIIGWPRLIIGVGLVTSGLLMTRYGSAGVGLQIQYYYSFIIQLGMVLLVPKFIQIGAWAVKPVMDKLFGVEGLIAVETMAGAARRTSSTVIALMIGLAFVFSYGAFIQSQKTAINRSIDRSVNGGILVASSGEIHSRTYHFAEPVADEIVSLPGIAKADLMRMASSNYDGQEILMISHDMAAYFEMSPDLLDVGDRESARSSTSLGKGMLVSNNFAARWNVNLGDVITLDTPSGPLSLPVVGMLDYYRSEKGTVFFDRSLYKKYWHDSDVDFVFIDLEQGTDPALFKNKVETLLRGQQKAFIYTHEEYKQWASAIVDQFFALMYVQMLVAFFVATIGLVNTMVISVAERKREIGIFRAIGGLRRQVLKMIILEAVSISIIGLVLGSVAGIMNAYFLVNTATRIVAGFTLPLIFPVSMVLAAIPIVIATAIISAWFPARTASYQNIVDAIGYE